MRHSPTARLSALAACVALSAGLVACGNNNDEGDPTPAPSETTSTTTPAESTETTTTSTEVEDAGDSTASASTTATSAKNGMPKDVAEAKKLFGSLAPASLFEDFDSCNPSGINDAYECSGAEVGQFQFFDSQSKAASTTQLLTELRSSRVVEDTGSRVVGWSTLGTTAVITVVDNDKGLVMQQMVSSDREDPEKKIYELGLASRTSSAPAEPTEDAS
ncbi:hypothetical protein HCH15_10615 [Corynebacterium testudinoris]|uniref:Beta-N-acetylglucosaminidase n=1 Tax=Corynebacterium testudinoris TaxID=136857 RepID=A0A0G3HAH4_9CORY|nr:hypothetical protein [Corynebacterium testudinoris]AKK08117.1 hypothetical protein CTEST_03310 [Corynebacterium testudinoris]MBX8996628.1 hypothetical protein [Corynebacterium testudinoris]